MNVDSINSIWKSIILCGLVAAVIVGCYAGMEYSTTPGQFGGTPGALNLVELPSGLSDQIQRCDNGEWQVILFYHPHCPCTQATVNNLNWLKMELSTSICLSAFAYRPVQKETDWIDTRITRQLRSLGTTVCEDIDGRWCKQFGALTSGQLLVYDENSRLVFQGGITASRGHEGRCDALIDLVRTINERCVSIRRWPVFGCPILDQSETKA